MALRVSIAFLVGIATSLASGAPSAHAGYAFTSHTFTSCGTTGRTGPAQATCRSNYSTTWDESDANFTVVNGIQYWTVPATGRYYIDAYGAGGAGAYAGGGARIADSFQLSEGEVIRILVGQTANTTVGVSANAGGGGTFVVRSPFNTNGSILVIAGGGGGSESGASQYLGAHASITTSGNNGIGTVSTTTSGAGGTAGNGGGTASSDNAGGGGGGFLTDGTRNTFWDNNGGSAFINGGAGALGGSTSAQSNSGGFGGGGGAAGKGSGGGAGAGGGYSGGGGSDNVSNGAGGGGGSYFANGLNINRVTTVDAIGENTNGYVTITLLAPPTANLSIAGNVKTVVKGNAIVLTLAIDQAGFVTFYADRKRIPGCINLSSNIGNKVCTWKPSVQKSVQVYATLSQNNQVVATSESLVLSTIKRSGVR